jgi:chorismate synthase
MLRFLTAGESHGQALVITVDGMPAGLSLDIDALNAQLRRRQGGYGRGRRMQIESDRAAVQPCRTRCKRACRRNPS